jgi:hypothetical protein
MTPSPEALSTNDNANRTYSAVTHTLCTQGHCLAHGSYASTSSPCLFTTASSFNAIPLGRFMPVSHF